MRARRVVVPLGVAAVLAAGALAARGIGGGAGPGDDEPDGLPPATATVSTTDLVQTVQVPGVLGYGTPVELPAKSDGGTLTWVAAPGAVVGQGQPVYAVDGEPVVLVHGTVPPYRTLEPGVAGPDVQQLEAALAALGYGGFQVDDEYHGSTADAVARWQDDLGVEETGTVTTGQIVVAPADLRIAEQTLAAGATLGGPEGGGAASVVTYTGTTPVVVVALDPAQQHLVAPGTAATVLLPDGATTAATVSAVSPVATAADTDDADTSTATIGVTVALADPAVAGALDAAPVDVGLVAAEAQDVLAVPVGALVALAEGGYAVQVVDGGQAAFVPVETGMFASGLVEVSGAGIEDGTVVGVPA